MKNTSAGKITKGYGGKPNLGVSAPSGSKPMPRVGGHTSNNAPGQGVGSDKGC